MDKILKELLARLPELEWQLGKMNLSLLAKQLPRGLFHPSRDATASAYINDIKYDIARLSTLLSYRKFHYLVEKIHQKIHRPVSQRCHQLERGNG